MSQAMAMEGSVLRTFVNNGTNLICRFFFVTNFSILDVNDILGFLSLADKHS